MGRSEAIIDRLHSLHPKLIDLSLERLQRLLAALGHPERNLPPVIHVAGTNGKGSVCAFLRAIAEAAGQRVHVYTSPHLVRFHERFRLAGRLVTEEALAAALEEVEAVNAGQPITVFEVTTAVGILLFSRVPADLLVLEVGLGGRYDATNVVDHPVACAIASISMDHMDFLGNTLAAIAAEKAGIIKPGVPVVTGYQEPEARAELDAEATAQGAPLHERGGAWTVQLNEDGLRYADPRGVLHLPPPALPGPHQAENAGIAIAALRAWNPSWLSDAAIAAGLSTAAWPARLQRLHGALAALLPPGWELWLDGGHNAGAGQALAAHLPNWADRPRHLVVGMKKGKESGAFLRPLLPLAESLWAVAEPGQHLAMTVEEIVAASGGMAHPGPHVADALRAIAASGGEPGRVLICGSLYLAGEVLKADGTAVD
ncbi:bifunctional folylpolyglutamate synthase/dihydrofolate synthase [Pseudoroseomonas ludipueritiae]|uniref:Bifunctional folylpolyglutamate synthase/dihydrofolate synthase n=1 Tax=Pseudoroseomonas ludipueritiae TaxID=198093 RepID=A0ABR7RFM9_9PROT|nr:folylpolyglutamate synthase/dihydrofolate synthase family protein [Pseudoroseomonas ludipueritiae]MBC9180282.1 bifunctional folylpolyglutamate synthase/dihydrofolate synthase [Pseudoroseomonas ludipueritiae]MCG7363026.1 bifunctional folylpolyglutamate synthase/dihydrofolate synthase [Roseomonas sp. ACRSG]